MGPPGAPTFVLDDVILGFDEAEHAGVALR